MILRLQQSGKAPGVSSRGFTLLELLIVMFLAGIVLASAVSLLVAPSDQKRLESQIGKVEQLGRQARGLAVLQQRPYRVRFSLGNLKLEPVGYQEGALATSAAEDIMETETLDREVEFSVLPWQSEWVLIEGDKMILDWVFEPTGLVEPISVKVKYDRSWIQQTFHTLTGEVSEEEREVY